MIDILITNYNTSRFLPDLLDLLEALTVNPYRVFINDNGSDAENCETLRMLSHKKDVFVYFRQCPLKGAWAHADAINFLMTKSKSPYTAIFDSDCYPLKYGWDQWMIDKISSTVKIIGSPLEPKTAHAKATGFPFQFMVLFETAIYKSLNIDASPRDIKLGEDTCWEWKPKFTESGYSGHCFTHVNTRHDPSGPFGKVLCAEYYTDESRCELIGSHFSRGTQIGQKYRSKNVFLRTLNKLFRFEQNIHMKEELLWKSICHRLAASSLQAHRASLAPTSSKG